MTGDQKPKIHRKIWILFGLCVALLAAQVLFFPLPRPVLHYLATNSAGWILNDNGRSKSIPGKMAQVFTGELIQQSMIAHFHDRYGKSQWKDDAAFAGMLLHALRPTLISQREIYHQAVGTPTAFSGLGWCDELNGVAGRLLAHDFDRIEIVGVNDPKTGGGHSFGRFWSKQHMDWLYFDIWTEEVLIFKIRAGKAPEYLFRSSPVDPNVVTPDDFGILRSYHAKAKQGFVHVRHQNSLAGHIGSRMWNFFAHGSTMPSEALAPIKALVEREKQAAPSKRIAPRHYNRQIRAYTDARLAQIFGDLDTAKSLYRSASQSDPKSSYGLASAKFLDRLTQSERN